MAISPPNRQPGGNQASRSRRIVMTPRPLHRSATTLAFVVPLLTILAASVWWAVGLWNSVDGPPMPAAGYAAMWLGIAVSLAVGCGLMVLLVYSGRHGFDEGAGGGG